MAVPEAPFTDAVKYHSVARILHWLIAIAVFGLIASGLYAEGLENSPFKLKIFFWHKSFGILVLGLMVLRILWRLWHRPPVLVAQSKMAKRAAGAGHAGLYFLLLLMPLSGWAIQSAANYPFQVFDLFPLPALVQPSKEDAELAALIHGVTSKILLLLVVGHMAAVAIHRWFGVHDVWPRMATQKVETKLLFLVIVLIGGRISADFISFEPPVVADNTSQHSSGAAGTEVNPARAPAQPWVQRPEESRLGFVATYDGIEFQGEFTKFNADILFDPTNLPGSRFVVTVDVTSAFTEDSTRDDALAGEDWFDYSAFPLARYEARTFSRQSDGRFIAKGHLTIKEYSHPVDVSFWWTESSDGASVLDVQAVVSRLDFGVGSGMWEDPIVGHEVVVESQLVLDKAN